MSEEISIRVLIVDDHMLMADSLAAALDMEPDLHVLDVAGSATQALELVRALRPDVVLLDFRLPDADGADVAAQIRHIDPAAQVLVLTGYDDDDALTRSIDAGCAGFLYKTADLSAVVDAVRLAHGGEPVFSARDLSRLVRQMRGEAPAGSDLTTRERQVLELLARGYTTDAIADQLFISKHTTRSHVRNILAKLEVHSKLEAVAMALRLGLVDVPRHRSPA